MQSQRPASTSFRACLGLGRNNTPCCSRFRLFGFFQHANSSHHCTTASTWIGESFPATYVRYRFTVKQYFSRYCNAIRYLCAVCYSTRTVDYFLCISCLCCGSTYPCRQKTGTATSLAPGTLELAPVEVVQQRAIFINTSNNKGYHVRRKGGTFAQAAGTSRRLDTVVDNLVQPPPVLGEALNAVLLL